ncbi:uncharacterized protein LOC143876886 [Tasmannia lanceolata]|uniref:uncharacterized protein LOC143876886 n=1 Tax=Tasmannia lanceolata TaxID=3420 RepID=UPI004062E1B0
MWTSRMDNVFLGELIEQMKLGRKVGGSFIELAWAKVEERMREKCDKNITIENCKNRLRTLKKHYVLVKSITELSGFGWNSQSCMVVAEDAVWDDYIMAHLEAKPFSGKPFPHFNEIGIVVGNDQACGSEAENFLKPPRRKLRDGTRVKRVEKVNERVKEIVDALMKIPNIE